MTAGPRFQGNFCAAETDNLSRDTEDEYMSTADDEEEEEEDVEESDEEEEEEEEDDNERHRLNNNFYDQKGQEIADEKTLAKDNNGNNELPLWENLHHAKSSSAGQERSLNLNSNSAPLHYQLETSLKQATTTTSEANKAADQSYNFLIEKNSKPSGASPTESSGSGSSSSSSISKTFKMKQLKKQSAIEMKGSIINMQELFVNNNNKASFGSKTKTKTKTTTTMKRDQTGHSNGNGNNNDNKNSNNNNNKNKRRHHQKQNSRTKRGNQFYNIGSGGGLKLNNHHHSGAGSAVVVVGTQQHGSGVIPQARIKTIKMTLVIVAAFILCWAPFYIINLCSVFGLIKKETNFTMALKTLTQSLAHLNSAVNPIIFWLFSSKRSQTQANVTRSSTKLASGEQKTTSGHNNNNNNSRAKSNTWLGRKFSIPLANQQNGSSNFAAHCGQFLAEIYYLIKRYLFCASCCCPLINSSAFKLTTDSRMFESTGTSGLRSQRLPSADVTNNNNNFIIDTNNNKQASVENAIKRN